jgi:hypothetical protein
VPDAAKLSFSEDTSRGTDQHGPTGPSRSFRYGHTTRFFTMINQPTRSLPGRGGGSVSGLSAASQTDKISFRSPIPDIRSVKRWR